MPRESDYKRSHHPKMAVKWGEQGYTKTQIAAKFGITRRTLYQWVDKHPEFQEAMELSETLAQAFNEALLHEIAVGTYPDAKPAAFIFKMKSQHKQDYADVRFVKTDSTVTVNNLNDDQLNKKIAAQLKMLPAEERRALLPQLGSVIEMDAIEYDGEGESEEWVRITLGGKG